MEPKGRKCVRANRNGSSGNFVIGVDDREGQNKNELTVVWSAKQKTTSSGISQTVTVDECRV